MHEYPRGAALRRVVRTKDGNNKVSDSLSLAGSLYFPWQMWLASRVDKYPLCSKSWKRAYVQRLDKKGTRYCITNIQGVVVGVYTVVLDICVH